MAGRRGRQQPSRSGTRDDVVPLTRMPSEQAGGGKLYTYDLPPGTSTDSIFTQNISSIPDKPLSTMPGQGPLLEVSDVGFYKAPGQPVFEHVDLALHEGEVVMLRGKSGSG
jgi:ABC-type multidrug transport system fused ATPase/permease subunit